MNSEKKFTFKRKVRDGARSLLLTNTLLALLLGSNLVSRLVPPTPTLNPDGETISLLQKNESGRNQRDKLIRIQASIETDKQMLATDELNSSQLLKINNDLIAAADRVGPILLEFKYQPLPTNPAKLTEFQANMQRIEKLEKLLAEVKKKSDEEKRRLVDGGTTTRSTLYGRAESLSEILREMLELRNFFLFARTKKEFVNTRSAPDLLALQRQLARYLT